MKIYGLNKNLKIIIYIAILIGIISTLILSQQGESLPKKHQKAVGGILDLARWDLSKDGNVNLEGEWEFYWNELLFSQDFKEGSKLSKPEMIKLPGTWNNTEINGKSMPKHGYATYRLTLKGSFSHKLYGFNVPNLSTSYRLWVNGEQIASNGTVGRNETEAQPQYRTMVGSIYMPAETNRIEIVIQVSNFAYKKGGIWRPITFGTLENVNKAKEKSLIFEIFLLGSYGIMLVYHLGFYILRRKDMASLYFGFFCFLFIIRIISTGEIYLTQLFPDFPWEWNVKMELLSFYVAVPVFALFMKLIFPDEFSRLIVRILSVIGLIFSGIVVVTPANFNGQTVQMYQIVTLGCIIFVISGVVKASIRKRKGAFIALAGLLVFGGTVINDMLYANELYSIFGIIKVGRYTAPIGLFVFLFSYSIMLSSRFAGAFTTVERLSERLLSLDKLKDEFLANTSHEIRTPLNGIIGLTESMIDGVAGKLNDQQVKNLSMIATSGRRLSHLLNDLLDFSRLKNKDIILQKKPVDVKQVAEIVISLSMPLASGKSLRINNDIKEDIPIVYGDENRLHQIIHNLIGNAVKFTEAGEIRVSARIHDNLVEIEVSDTGIGIPSDKLEDIFKSFEQVDGSISRKYGGTGLGLYITKHLVELHGGTIRVESEVGRGTNFIFTLPIYTGKAIESEEQNQAGQREVLMVDFGDSLKSVYTDEVAAGGGYIKEGDFAAQKVKILVVDDEPINVQVLVNQLALENYLTVTASNGAEALQKIEQDKEIELVILDVMMPKMSGFEVCKRLRETYSLIDLPIVMLTAKSQIMDIAEGFAVGANDYVTKPFSKVELLARIKTLITLKRIKNEALNNAHHLEYEKQKRVLVEKLQEISSALTSTLDLREVLGRLLDSLGSMINYDHAAVLLKQGESLHLMAAQGFEYGDGLTPAKIDIESITILAEVVNNGKPALFTNLEDKALSKEVCFNFNNTSTLLAVPLISKKGVIGILTLDSSIPSFYGNYEMEIALAFAGQAGIAIENATLFSEVKKLATTDALTGLYNRRYFFEVAEAEFKRLKSQKIPMSMIMLDIDYFKRVNDTYGHTTGDEILRDAAQRFLRVLRIEDVIGRYGGEEFVALLPGTDSAAFVAERLRKSIAREPFTTQEHGLLNITISIGATIADENTNDLDTMIKRADEALYEAKKAGRNCVVLK
ncbi:MAG: diguanylate cyclase [Clostridia bacterium]|nr:diguanylate cyclase [Clostridia bacterium]